MNSEREEVLKALEVLWDAVDTDMWDDGPDGISIGAADLKIRAAIDRAYPPEEDEDGDPVGAAPGWIIEITNGKEWARVPLGPENGFATEDEARAFATSMQNARVRWTGDPD